MKLMTRRPHTYDGKSYEEGDVYDVADPLIAETIIANGMAAPAPAPEAPPAHPKPPAKHAR